MFVNAEEQYNIWNGKLKDNEFLSNQLVSMGGRTDEIVDCFGSCLNFGTAGARGLIGVGPNRMNSVTVSHISSAYSDYLNAHVEAPSLVISYDTRRYSNEFAKVASEVFVSNGIKVYFFKDPSPIGILSFAIRKLKCSGGVMITASHNPPEYNGYKIYNNNGAQPVNIDEIISILKNKDMFDFNRSDFNESLLCNKINIVSNDIEQEYIKNIRDEIGLESINDINITYSPLNGCSSKIFCKLFYNCKLNIVDKQNCQDELFTTCNPPDPQKEQSFSLALEVAKKNNSDLIILNDPDGDRLGIAVNCGNSYRILTALEIAALFLNFIIETKGRKKVYVIKSMVSCGICDEIVNYYKVKCIQTPPGFKYISQEIEKIDQNSETDTFVFGFEESNGFLLFDNVRDKDGISSSAYFCKMLSYYKSNKLNCVDILNQLYKKFGHIVQKNISIRETNRKEIDKFIDKIKAYFSVNKSGVVSISDYRHSETIDLKSNKITSTKMEKLDILEINFHNKSKLFARASGTEPLIKFYIIYDCKISKDFKNKIEEIISNI